MGFVEYIQNIYHFLLIDCAYCKDTRSRQPNNNYHYYHSNDQRSSQGCCTAEHLINFLDTSIRRQSCIHSCIVCLQQVDLMEPISLQVKLQLMFSNLKTPIEHRYMDIDSICFSLGSTSPSNAMSSQNWPYMQLWNPVQPLCQIAAGLTRRSATLRQS